MIREELLAALHRATHPLTTAELAALMPWRPDVLPVPCELLCNAPAETLKVRVLECHWDWHVVEIPRTAQDSRAGVYRHLTSMARQHLVRQIKVRARVVQWEAIP